ncbi:hypothetical protein BDR07DRAFT_1484234 [Suillus spraguei]|nr:hypothetical protein BDR07DRAFT_1484234 [Suillus spraguei]
MDISLDDPQTYNWHDWAKKQEIPGLWGRLPDHPTEYQTAMFEAIRAKIALEPNTESSGPCSEMWCKGIINMMCKIRQEIQDESAANESNLKVLESSIDDNVMNKRRGRPKGVLNSTIIKLQSLSISPMKLPSKNVAESLLLSSGQDPISKDSISQVVKGGFTASNSAKKKIPTSEKNDVPALDLSTLFCAKFTKIDGKPQSIKRVSQVSQQISLDPEQISADIMKTCATPTSRQPSNIFISSSDPPSFSDDTEPWDYSSDAYMVSNEVMDQDMDVDISQEKSASEVSADVVSSSPSASLNYPEEFDFTASISSGSSPLLGEDLEVQVSSSPNLPLMDYEQSPITSSSARSLSIQEELGGSPAITSKTCKGTLTFVKSAGDEFVYDSVTFVPNIHKSKSKSKVKGKGKSKEQPQSVHCAPKNFQTPSISHIQTSVVDSSNSSQRLTKATEKEQTSMTTLTLSANMSKVAKACQKSQASFKSESLMWNEKFLKFFSSLGFDWTRSDELQSDIKRQIGKAMASKDVQKQIKTHMHIIVQYVCWMKSQREAVKLPEESKIGFRVLFTLLEMEG